MGFPRSLFHEPTSARESHFHWSKRRGNCPRWRNKCRATEKDNGGVRGPKLEFDVAPAGGTRDTMIVANKGKRDFYFSPRGEMRDYQRIISETLGICFLRFGEFAMLPFSRARGFKGLRKNCNHFYE